MQFWCYKEKVKNFDTNQHTVGDSEISFYSLVINVLPLTWEARILITVYIVRCMYGLDILSGITKL